MQAILAVAGAIAAALSPFALVGGFAALFAHYDIDPDATSGWSQLALGACLIAMGFAVSISAYGLFRTLFERALQRRQQPLADWTDLDGRFALLLRTFRDDRRRILHWSMRFPAVRPDSALGEARAADRSSLQAAHAGDCSRAPE